MKLSGIYNGSKNMLQGGLKFGLGFLQLGVSATYNLGKATIFVSSKLFNIGKAGVNGVNKAVNKSTFSPQCSGVGNKIVKDLPSKQVHSKTSKTAERRRGTSMLTVAAARITGTPSKQDSNIIPNNSRPGR